MSISQNFPSTRPSLNLNFARSQKLDPRITFTRSSTATYTGGDGLIKSAATDTPRFDFNATTGECLGLLIEESRTNLQIYSEQFDNAFWGKTNAGITTNTTATTAPDGTNNADKLVEDTSNGQHFIGKANVLTNSIQYTLSVFVKPAERTKMLLGAVKDDGNFVGTYFDLSAGTAYSTFATPDAYSIVSYSNGWYRCNVTITNSATGSGDSIGIYLLDASGNFSYTGNGTSGIYIWGAQLEAGAFPTSYIPTVASTVTRSADNASITGTNFSSWYNSTEGTLFAAARINALGGSNYPGIAYVDDGTANNCIGLTINDAGTDVVGAEAYVSNSNQYYFNSSSAVVANQLIKAITAYKVNDFAGAFNIGSNTVQTDTSGSVPTVNRLIIGDLRGNNAKLNGTISQLSYYPVRLSNSQLQSLTK